MGSKDPLALAREKSLFEGSAQGATSVATPDRPKRTREVRETAETLASKQKDISVSEFFAKNRHLLGFDNPRKALLTSVKEAVDNSLDACEEAGILPNITVIIEDLQPDRPATLKQSRYRKSPSSTTARASPADRSRTSSAGSSSGPSSTA